MIQNVQEILLRILSICKRAPTGASGLKTAVWICSKTPVPPPKSHKHISNLVSRTSPKHLSTKITPEYYTFTFNKFPPYYGLSFSRGDIILNSKHDIFNETSKTFT
jgi:hypothetical protein